MNIIHIVFTETDFTDFFYLKGNTLNKGLSQIFREGQKGPLRERPKGPLN